MKYSGITPEAIYQDSQRVAAMLDQQDILLENIVDCDKDTLSNLLNSQPLSIYQAKTDTFIGAHSLIDLMELGDILEIEDVSYLSIGNDRFMVSY